MARSESKTTFIYFLYAERANTIKIGYTTNLKERFKKIQSLCPEPLTLLRAVRGDMSYEKFLHRKFLQYRTHGEWYTLNPELLDFIDSLEWAESFQK